MGNKIKRWTDKEEEGIVEELRQRDGTGMEIGSGM